MPHPPWPAHAQAPGGDAPLDPWAPLTWSPPTALDPGRLLPIVVGAGLGAEQGDRPCAYALAGEIQRRLAAGHARDDAPSPLVCCDVWYLNHNALRALPTIAVGPPEHNALSAFLVGRLPRVLSVDERLAVHLDLYGHEPVVCCWGVDAAATAQACRAFAQRYLRAWLKGV